MIMEIDAIKSKSMLKHKLHLFYGPAIALHREQALTVISETSCFATPCFPVSSYKLYESE